MASDTNVDGAASGVGTLTAPAIVEVRHPGWVGGILAGLAAGALWGMVFVAPLTVPGFAAEDFAVWRYLACGAFSMGMLCVPLLRGRRVVLPTRQQAVAAMWLTLLGYTGYYLLLVLAIERAGSVLPTLIIGTIPIWVMVLGKPHGVSWRGLLPGLVLTMAGLVLMMQMPHGSGVATGEGAQGVGFWTGIALAVAAMVSWTAYALLNAAWLRRHPEVSSANWASWSGVAAGVGALCLWPWLGTPVQDLMQKPDLLLFLLVCGATGIGAAWVASVAWNVASRRLSPSLAGQLIVSETVFGVVYAYAWAGRWPSALEMSACLLFVLGILASIRAHR
ncbi:MAG TPA: DMT family transporter [Burkholderiaceae bacterium]|nr:DMT family transporter [Burkholderiaceae bacterium]